MADITFSGGGGSISGTVATNLLQVASTSTSSGGLSNVTPTAGMLNVLGGLRYNASAPTLTDGYVNSFQGDVKGNLNVNLNTLISGEDQTNNVMKVEQQYNPNYISTATTTVVKTGAGVLHTIVVQGGTAGTIIVYDNTTAAGTIIASFDSTNAIASYAFDAKVALGITVVTSAATKLTVNYR